MTLATVNGDGVPRTANLFYAFDEERRSFIFTSSLTTAHATAMSRCPAVGANIVLETKNIGRIEGLQIEGHATRPTDKELSRVRSIYLKKFPFAIVADLELWSLRADFVKMTDNKLGFGKKILWIRDQK